MVLSIGVYVVCGLTALLGVYAVAKDLSADLVLLGGCALVGVLWACEFAGIVLRDLAGGTPPSAVTLYGYLLTGLLLAAAGIWFGLAERSRFGSAVVLIAVVTIAVLQMRIPQIWSGALA